MRAKSAFPLPCRNEIKRHGRGVIAPFPCLSSVVCFGIGWFAGDRVQSTPIAAHGFVALALRLFGKLFIRNEFFHFLLLLL